MQRADGGLGGAALVPPWRSLVGGRKRRKGVIQLAERNMEVKNESVCEEERGKVIGWIGLLYSKLQWS